MRIIFVRHGEPDYAHDCLTDLGRSQAKAAAIRLREEGIEELWSSPLGRAKEMAEAASVALGLPVRILDFMQEVTWGATDDAPLFAGGHPWAIVNEMARQGIELNRPDWRTSPYFRTNRVTACVDRIETGIDEWLAVFGYVREGAYYRRTSEEKQPRTVALFSHGGSSCAAMGHILNLPFPFACALIHLDYAGITVVRLDGKTGELTLPRLEMTNDFKHIRQADVPESAAVRPEEE